MKNLYLITAFIVLCNTAVKAQQPALAAKPAYNFSLADCINYAYEHQDSVKNALLSVKSADYRVKEIIGLGLPQINGSASFQDYLKIPQVLFPDFITPAIYGVLKNEGVSGTNGPIINLPAGAGGFQSVSLNQKYSNNFGIDVSQLLFDGTYLVGLKASKTYKELSQRNFDRTKIQANVGVTKAYYQVLVSDEQIKLLNANITQLKQQLDETIQRNKQGFVEKIDVDRLTVQYNNLVTSRENTIRSLVLNYELLKFQMGMPIKQELTLTEKLDNVKLDSLSAENVAAIDTGFYRNRVEFSLLETAEKLNELDLKRKRAQYLPSLAAFGNTSLLFQNNNIGNLYSTNYPSAYVGVKLNVPIFNGFQRVNQVKQTQIAVQKAQNDLEDVKNALSLQASVAKTTYINGLQSLNNQKRSRELANEVLRVSKIKYQQGVGSSIEVTQAQTELENADNQYIQALYNALISRVDLDKAYGRIK
jgi:outer membrane protein